MLSRVVRERVDTRLRRLKMPSLRLPSIPPHGLRLRRQKAILDAAFYGLTNIGRQAADDLVRITSQAVNRRLVGFGCGLSSLIEIARLGIDHPSVNGIHVGRFGLIRKRLDLARLFLVLKFCGGIDADFERLERRLHDALVIDGRRWNVKRSCRSSRRADLRDAALKDGNHRHHMLP